MIEKRKFFRTQRQVLLLFCIVPKNHTLAIVIYQSSYNDTVSISIHWDM